ncbi:MAG: arginase [Caldilineaceae bacterium]|nr:arginase [Caldilineaceae bacterium]
MRTIQIVGAPMDLGQGRRGVDMGPFALRYAELERRLEALGYAVTDLGNLDVPGPEEDETPPDAQGLRHLGAVARVNRQLAECCRDAVTAGAIPLALGGDHSMAAGSVAGVRAAGRVGVLWVDAHADFNTPQTSPSRNLHGMPLGALLGQEPAALAPYLTEERLAVEDVIILGLRSVDGGERELLRRRGVTVFSMRDIDEQGIAAVMRRVLDHFTRHNLERLHISFDADSLDPAIAPGVGTPVPGGLSYREAHLIMELLADDGRVGSMDIVEINPILDDRNHTADLCVALAASLLGQSIL